MKIRQVDYVDRLRDVLVNEGNQTTEYFYSDIEKTLFSAEEVADIVRKNRDKIFIERCGIPKEIILDWIQTYGAIENLHKHGYLTPIQHTEFVNQFSWNVVKKLSSMLDKKADELEDVDHE